MEEPVGAVVMLRETAAVVAAAVLVAVCAVKAPVELALALNDRGGWQLDDVSVLLESRTLFNPSLPGEQKSNLFDPASCAPLASAGEPVFKRLRGALSKIASRATDIQARPPGIMDQRWGQPNPVGSARAARRRCASAPLRSSSVASPATT
jgi:hypothetical protein